MSDWRKTQYKIGPSPDPLADPMAGENLWFGFAPWAVIGGFVLAAALLIGWVLTL